MVIFIFVFSGYFLLKWTFSKYQNLSDIYNYVVSFYNHITKPIHLYINKEREIEVPNNNKILIKNYLQKISILSSTNMNTPVVYKFYMDLCFEHKHRELNNIII